MAFPNLNVHSGLLGLTHKERLEELARQLQVDHHPKPLRQKQKQNHTPSDLSTVEPPRSRGRLFRSSSKKSLSATDYTGSAKAPLISSSATDGKHTRTLHNLLRPRTPKPRNFFPQKAAKGIESFRLDPETSPIPALPDTAVFELEDKYFQHGPSEAQKWSSAEQCAASWGQGGLEVTSSISIETVSAATEFTRQGRRQNLSVSSPRNRRPRSPAKLEPATMASLPLRPATYSLFPVVKLPDGANLGAGTNHTPLVTPTAASQSPHLEGDAQKNRTIESKLRLDPRGLVSSERSRTTISFLALEDLCYCAGKFPTPFTKDFSLAPYMLNQQSLFLSGKAVLGRFQPRSRPMRILDIGGQSEDGYGREIAAKIPDSYVVSIHLMDLANDELSSQCTPSGPDLLNFKALCWRLPSGLPFHNASVDLITARALHGSVSVNMPGRGHCHRSPVATAEEIGRIIDECHRVLSPRGILEYIFFESRPTKPGHLTKELVNFLSEECRCCESDHHSLIDTAGQPSNCAQSSIENSTTLCNDRGGREHRSVSPLLPPFPSESVLSHTSLKPVAAYDALPRGPTVEVFLHILERSRFSGGKSSSLTFRPATLKTLYDKGKRSIPRPQAHAPSFPNHQEHFPQSAGGMLDPDKIMRQERLLSAMYNECKQRNTGWRCVVGWVEKPPEFSSATAI